ncbi:MAG: hypothetical protein JW913_04715 [Chitinispirillaceae bacterium]|nr:hypothetical protein [Chitinispirillaceae bacterium]
MRRFFLLSSVVGIVCPAFIAPVNAQTDSALAGRMMETLRKTIDPAEQMWRLEQHRLYRQNNPPEAFQRSPEFRLFEGRSAHPLYGSPAAPVQSASAVKKILVLANKTLYADAIAKEKIDRYIDDVRNGHGCTVVLETLEGGKPADIKAVIKEHYDNGGLDGAVQIGKLPAPWYESDNDPTTGAYDDYTCDLYFMDLDGQWGDANNNGEFDSHIAGTGTLGIEIFYGRVDCTTMGSYGTEIDLLSEYMDKLHNYYLGNVPLNPAALGYLDYDWRTSDNHLKEIYPASGSNELIRWTATNPPVNKSDYLNNRLQKNYSALQMWCHAGYNAHSHHTGGNSSMGEVYKANPKPIAYFHDGCHVSDFAAGRGKSFLGGCYVFNKSPTALMCLSGSRSGQWLGLMAKVMFQELAKNASVGQAFKTWFAPYQNKSEPRDKQNFIGWNYGYNIFGDPMITLVSRNGVTAVRETAPPRNLDIHYARHGGAVTFFYTLPGKACVDLDLLSLTGKQVQSLTSGMQDPGPHSVTATSSAVANGAYIISLKTGSMHGSQRLNIVK